MQRVLILTSLICWTILNAAAGLRAAESKPTWQIEWDKTVEAAKKEGKVVAALPNSADTRKNVGEAFAKRFPGIELEISSARGPSNAAKITAEHAAGARYFDLLVSGTSTPFNLVKAGVSEPIEPLLILPEVRDPKLWFGGHVWLDIAKTSVYGFQSFRSDNFWYNPTLLNTEEIRSYDDLLNPKWKGKIGYLDPRTGGGGSATWAFLLKTKGEEFLRKFAAQDLFLSRDQRQLADTLAKAKVSFTVGLSYYTFAPFLKVGLPIKPMPDMKEGSYTSCGSGALTILKGSSRPNATKVFVNWLLSKEGQDIYSKAMGQATRRLDIDTKALADVGSRASKDFISVAEASRLENYTEETVNKYWDRSKKIAEEVFK